MSQISLRLGKISSVKIKKKRERKKRRRSGGKWLAAISHFPTEEIEFPRVSLFPGRRTGRSTLSAKNLAIFIAVMKLCLR